MAGYWPSSFFAFLSDRDEVEVYKATAKRSNIVVQHLLVQQC